MITIPQLLILMQTLPALISAGIMVKDQISSVIKMFFPTMTEDELNAIVGIIIINAESRKIIADRDSGVNN